VDNVFNVCCLSLWEAADLLLPLLVLTVNDLSVLTISKTESGKVIKLLDCSSSEGFLPCSSFGCLEADLLLPLLGALLLLPLVLLLLELLLWFVSK
jgi:hypothetical protein